MNTLAVLCSVLKSRGGGGGGGGGENCNRRPVGSVGRVPNYRAGGRGFKPRPDQHSLITEEKVLPLLTKLNVSNVLTHIQP